MSYENPLVDRDVKKLLESAAIGEAARMFLESDLGKHIINRAAEEIDEAVFALVDIDPVRISDVARLQNEIKVARQSIFYLTDAISAGENALSTLEEPPQ